MRASTVQHELAQATRLLDPVSDTPRLDSELLLSHALRRQRSYLFAHPEHRLARNEITAFSTLTERRANGEPVAYICGTKEFWSLPLTVSRDVLVPRPETELLVEVALKCLRAREARVADLGTGSGAIALALAHERPDWELVAADISQAALNVANANAERLGVTNISFRRGSWFDAVADETFDLIVSNPPYVAPNDPHLNALAFEPREALVSQGGGLDHLTAIITQAREHLVPGGYVIVEHGHEQGGVVGDMLSKSGLVNVEHHSDMTHTPRACSGQHPG